MSKLTTLNLLHICNDGFLGSLPLLLPFIKIQLGLNLTQVGFLGTLLNVMAIMLALPSGYIAERWGGLRTLTLAMALYAVGFLITSGSMTYLVLMAGFLCASAGFGLFHPIALSLIAKWTTPATRGRQMGNFTAIGDIGRISLATGVTVIATHWGWRLTGALYGVIALVACGLFYRFNTHDTAGSTGERTSSVSLKQVLTHRRFLLVSASAMIDAFASFSLIVFLPFLLMSKGISPAALGTFTGVYFVGHFIGKSGVGRLVDAFGNVRIFVLAEVCMAGVILWLAASTSWLTLVAASLALGALTKGTIPALTTMVAEAIDDPRAFDKAYGVNSMAVGLASTIAPTIYGLVADHWGLNTVFNVSAVMAIIATLPVILLRLSYEPDAPTATS